MTDYLNVWVCDKVVMSVPLKSESQREAAGRIGQGAHAGNTLIFIEDKPRRIEVAP